jgi:hypothetical protein
MAHYAVQQDAVACVTDCEATFAATAEFNLSPEQQKRLVVQESG